MKAKYEKELNKVNLSIETNLFYEEDYQMKMLRQNEIAGLAKVECQHMNGESVFKYDVSNMISLRKKHEMMELRGDDIYQFVEVLIKVVEEVQSYFLNPDCLVLDPGLIYWNKEKWGFLYLPLKKSNLNKAFHELTEYFVKTLDYKEMEGIQLASFLHKETLQENFSLKDIFDRYEETYKRSVTKEEGMRGEEDIEHGRKREQEREELPEDFLSNQDEYAGINIENYQTVEGQMGEYQAHGEDRGKSHKKEKTQKKSNKFTLGKDKVGTGMKRSKSRWGEWEDLITE